MSSDSRVSALQVNTPQGQAGTLHHQSQYVFNYETSDASRQVALSMPLRHESYAGNQLPGAFTQNLPEGYLLQRLQAQLGRYEKLTDMRLLALLGNRQIGRLQFYEPGKPLPEPHAVELAELLHGGRSPDLFEYLLERFMASGISGVQPKVLATSSQRAAKSAFIAPDLIIKSAGADYPFLTQNEYLCMSVAKHAGLAVPDFWLSDDQGLFILRRFDLSESGMLGFEDMATLLGKSREATGNYKYQGSHEAVAKVIGALCPADLESYFGYVALSVLLRNGDAHLKNFGLLYQDPSQPRSIRLSPVFDVVTTTIYSHMTYRSDSPVIDHTLALKLGGTRTYPSYEQLLAFGRKACLVEKPAQWLERLTESALETLTAERERFAGHEAFARLEQVWQAGLMLSGRPAHTRVTISNSLIDVRVSDAVHAFWHANPLLEDMLQQLQAAGHAADAPWQPEHPTAAMLATLKQSASTEVLKLEAGVRRAINHARGARK